MQVACEHCSAEYEVEESEITGRGVRITCPACSHVFVVYHTPKEPSFEMDIDIELDDNGEFSMDLDAMLNSIIDETETAAGNTQDASGPDITDAKDDNNRGTGFEIDVEFDNVQFDEAQADVVPTQNMSTQSETAVASTEDGPVSLGESAVDEASGPQADTEAGHDGDSFQKVTPEQIAAMDVHSLNFASVGIKSWKVKKPIGLMFEYSDYKTFQKSLNDGRISSGDQISPDGKEWTPMSDIEDFEMFFCKTYAEFEQKETVPEVKAVKEKVIPSLGGTNELASALAAAQAEVEQANRPQIARKAPPKRPSRKPQQQSKSHSSKSGQGKSSGLLVNAGVGLAVIIGVILLFGGSEDEVVVNNPTAPTKVVTATKDEKSNSEDESLKALREELRRDAAKIEAEQAPEPEPSAEEPQLIAKVPEEILAQQRALKEGKASVPVKKTVNHALEGQQALQAQQWAKAIQSFTVAFQTNPNPEFLASVGYAQFKSGQLDSAKKTLMKASKQGSVTANKWLGYVLREEGDVAGSNQYFNQYLQSNPSDAALIKQEMMQ